MKARETSSCGHICGRIWRVLAFVHTGTATEITTAGPNWGLSPRTPCGHLDR
jgi:hypothetical protein